MNVDGADSLSETRATEKQADPVPALALVNLSKSYGTAKAVDGLTLTVSQGLFFGFLGPNGAGKTTTIKMLTGLAQPDGGTVEVLGLRLPEQSLEIRRQIGIVPDDSLLFDYLTGSEYLEFVARLYETPKPVAKMRANELVELFQLGDHRRKLIGDYSKGMRKRVAMAAALIHRPRLFLMDEPFEGVDAVGARLMKDILLAQVRNGATVFLTSHVLDVVERICDEIAIVNGGKLVVQGTVAQLREQASQRAATLEEIFVNLVGSAGYAGKLDWL
ncbi:MAG: ABC transporter ATP-binding protein [Bryobacteraceae bacterium]